MIAKDKSYYIWVIEVLRYEEGRFYYPIALSYEPNQWFADLFKHSEKDSVYIREFITNLLSDNQKDWLYCNISIFEHGIGHIVSVYDVGTTGNTPVMCYSSCYRPNMHADWTIDNQFVPFQEVGK